MKILIKDEIQRAVIRCAPSKIAVAYIGADWKTFVPDAHRLKAIIVSPTIGSNPGAIADLVKIIGWEKVAFLDELHAKTYIGNSSAIIGSANLTGNGLSGENLVELCVEVSPKESLNKLNDTFETLWEVANNRYPTTESKKERLKELEKAWGAAVANRIVKCKKTIVPVFSDFELLGNDHFYVLWYKPAECKHSEAVKAIESKIKYETHFARNDKAEINKWVLAWKITNSLKPYKNIKPYWIYIHEIYDNGVIDEGYDYPKCAIQRKDLDVPPAPFEITNEVAAAFNKAVQDKGIAQYLIQDGRLFSLADSQKGVPLLISSMKVDG